MNLCLYLLVKCQLSNHKLNINKIIKKMLKIPNKYKKTYIKYYNNQLFDVNKYNQRKRKNTSFIFLIINHYIIII